MNTRTRAGRRIAALASTAIACTGLALVTAAPAEAALTKAVSTTTNIAQTDPCEHGGNAAVEDVVNCNLYASKQDVWLSGLPTSLPSGTTYFFAVLEPGSQPNPNDGQAGNLSSPHDTRVDRSFTVGSDGLVDGAAGHGWPNAQGKLQMAPFEDTSNNGGVYILAVCALPDGDTPVQPSSCKYDAFKVLDGEPNVPDEDADPLTVVKDADGGFTRTYGWTIDKSVDRTAPVYAPAGGTVPAEYTVVASPDPESETDSDFWVSGTITVHNPNTHAVTEVDVTDVLSDGTVCDVTGGAGVAVEPGDNEFAYECELTGPAQGQLDNTASAEWPDQAVGNAFLAGSAEDPATFTFEDIQFDDVTQADTCVDLTDAFDGGLEEAIGIACVDDPTTHSKTYTRQLEVPALGCVVYDNTAYFTGKETGTRGEDSASATVCGFADTGARTMGFWQNKNGQDLIKQSTSTSTVVGTKTIQICNINQFLRQFAPFKDLVWKSTCAQTATYAYNQIKAASAGGASMDKMLKGQMLATALDVWFTGNGWTLAKAGKFFPNSNLGGLAIDLTQPQDTTAAFVGVSPTTVMNLLTHAAAQYNTGGLSWYGSKSLQEKAKNTFDAINNEKVVAVP